MDQFRYTAKDSQGENRTGVIEAVDVKQASTLLHDMGLVVIKIVPKTESIGIGVLIHRFRGTSTGSVANFTRQLATMINAGLSLTDALVILEKQISDLTIKQAIREVTKD